METSGKTSADGSGALPVNRFALFAETLLAGVIVLGLSLPLVTVPAAYAAGTAHLERHLSGRDDSLRGLWATFRSALPGSWKLGTATAAGAVAVIINLLLAVVGQLPARAVVLPATLFLAVIGAVLLLRTASLWSGFASERMEGATHSGAWARALSAAKQESLRDWTGSLLLIAALFMAVVFVWMLPALVLIVPGTLLLAAAAVRIRARRP